MTSSEHEWRRHAAVLLLVGTLLGSVLALGHPTLLGNAIQRIAADLRALGTPGLILSIAIQVLVAASGILPASLVGIVAGALYGLVPGFAIAAASLLVGALLTFGLSRSLFRSIVDGLLPNRPRLRNLDAMVARDGWKLVCLLRASPLMPFAATSYALGLTSVGPLAYLAGTLASLPALLGYVALGTCADTLTGAGQGGLGSARTILLLLGLAATVFATVRVGTLVWRATRPEGSPALTVEPAE